VAAGGKATELKVGLLFVTLSTEANWWRQERERVCDGGSSVGSCWLGGKLLLLVVGEQKRVGQINLGLGRVLMLIKILTRRER